MKIATHDAAQIIHEVERTIANRSPLAADAESRIEAPVWEETSPAYRDARSAEVRAYLDTGEVDTVGDADVFKTIVDSLR